jgi:hypothetical protein
MIEIWTVNVAPLIRKPTAYLHETAMRDVIGEKLRREPRVAG